MYDLDLLVQLFFSILHTWSLYEEPHGASRTHKLAFLKWDFPQLLNMLPFSSPSLILFYLYAPGRFSESLHMDYKGNKQIMEK